MNQMYKALVAHFQAQREEALAVIYLYLSQPVGVADHSNILKELVDWVDDDVYINAIRNRKDITDKDHTLRFYRADQIQKFDLNKTVQTLLKLQTNNAE